MCYKIRNLKGNHFNVANMYLEGVTKSTLSTILAAHFCNFVILLMLKSVDEPKIPFLQSTVDAFNFSTRHSLKSVKKKLWNYFARSARAIYQALTSRCSDLERPRASGGKNRYMYMKLNVYRTIKTSAKSH